MSATSTDTITTDETETTSTEPTETTPRRRRKRTGKKRTRFCVPPRQPASVRALWQSATAEEQKTAHELCMAMLEYWLGKSSKLDIARRLEVPPLRIWQLSQMALAGMLAGLLRQPKTRPRGHPAGPPATPEQDPRILKGRIVELERKLSRTEDLVRVLKDLPWAPKETPQAAQEERDGRAGTGRKSKGRRGAQASRRSEARGRQDARRGRAGGNAGGDGAVAEGDDADPARLEEAGDDGSR
jgi:hypothetical protein